MKLSRLTNSIQKKLSLRLVFILLALLIGCARADKVKDKADQNRDANSPQGIVELISKALSEKAIGKMEILQIPPRIITTARVTPEMLEKQYHSKLIIRDVGST